MSSRKARDALSAISRALKGAVARGELGEADMERALHRLAAAPARGKRTRPEAAGRRDDILSAAVRLFVTKGYHAATLESILDELGLTRPAFYYYFKSKQEILEAICRKSVAAADEVVDRELARDAATATELLAQTLRGYANHIISDDSVAVMLRNYEEMSPPERQRLTTQRRARQRKVLQLVKRGMSKGEFNVVEPHIAVLTAFEAIHAIHNWYHRTGRLSREAVCDVIVDQLLTGMLRPAEARTMAPKRATGARAASAGL